MGIFDEVAQGINKGIAKVQTRSQEMLQIYGINNQIRSQENKRTSVFIEIGRIIYDKFQHGASVSDDQLEEKTRQIAECEEEINRLKTDLEAIKSQAGS